MINIIRNCVHSNDMYIGFLSSEDGIVNQVIRTTFSSTGVKRIEREIEGLTKYCQSINIPLENEILKSCLLESYGILHLKYHSGSTGNYFLPITKNKKKFLSLITYYTANLSGFSHGDLSIGNIVFKEDKVEWIFDWENYNSILPQEYDLIYALTENCLFLQEQQSLTKEDISTYWELIETVGKKYHLDKIFKRNPAMWLNNQVTKYINLSNVNHTKCPFFCKSQDFLEKLDHLLINNSK